MRTLPIGISTFQKIREEGHIYVDKTIYIEKLLAEGDYYFLSRPRRFGKSLLVDTIRELYEGNEPLFKGLHIHSSWDWETQHPVLSFSFARGGIQSAEQLHGRIQELLQAANQRLDLNCEASHDNGKFFSDILEAAQKTHGQKVVVLIDEYDKPLLDNITNTEIATKIRNTLGAFYSTIKAQDANIKFAFLTGVSKFSKVSIFSGLNNLRDITLSPSYSAMCGYTQQELEENFTQHLEGADLEEVRAWYNGYSWEGEKVYNPAAILAFLQEEQQFASYWFETATPGFLIELLKQRYYHIPDFENLRVPRETLGQFEVDHLDIAAILFQTGYLTISNVERRFGKPIYTLQFPNKEVRTSFNDMVLRNYLIKSHRDPLPLAQALEEADTKALEEHFRALFAGIANENYRKNSIGDYEGYYASVMYASLASLGFEVHAEESTNRGRIDLTVALKNSQGVKIVYIFEFKAVDSSSGDDAALAQIKQKGYAEKYRTAGARILLVGIAFDKTSRSVSSFTVEEDAG